MNQEIYIIASTHSVAVLYTYWNYEDMLLMIPLFKTGQVSKKVKQDLIRNIPGHYYSLKMGEYLIPLLYMI